MRDQVAALVDEARIPAVVAGSAPPSQFATTMAGAHLVLAPLRMRHGEVLGPGSVGIDALVSMTDGIAVFAHAAGSVELDVQPDDADAAALATAHDRATELSARAEELSDRAGRLLVHAEIARLEHAGSGNGTARLVAEAEDAASKAQRTYLDARARAEEAWRVVRGDRSDRGDRRGRSRTLGAGRRRLSPGCARGQEPATRSLRMRRYAALRRSTRVCTSVRRSIGRSFEGYASSTTRSSSSTRSS